MKNKMIKAKGIIALLTFSIMVFTIGMTGISAFAQSNMVSDIEDHWAYNEISTWLDQGLAMGYPDGTFKPNNGITRAEFATLVNRAFKLVELATVTFKDIKEDDWFYVEIARAKQAGYLNGYEDGTIKPDAFITRQEVAAIIARLKSLQDDTSRADSFTDANSIPAWSRGFIGAVVNANYMRGYPDGNFQPTKNITRAESIAALNNILEIKIVGISQQKVEVNRTKNVSVKTEPADAQISIRNSDDKIVKAALNGAYIELKGLKEGSAVITIVAEKDGFLDGITSFDVVVEKAAGGGGGGGGSTSHSSNNSKPVITVVEPDGLNDGIITLMLGAQFVAPVVTAADNEDGNITSRIVKLGEDKVDTSKAGDYILTYNVTDLKGSPADERKVTVRVVAGDAVANITVDVAEDMSVFKTVTVNSSSVGTRFKVEGSSLTKVFGEGIWIETPDASRIVSIVDDNGDVVGTIIVNVGGDSRKDYAFKAIRIDSDNAVANISVDVAELMPSFKNLSVNSSTVGRKFKVEGSSLIGAFGEKITINTAQASIPVYILDISGNVVGTITVPVNSDSTSDYTFKTPKVKETAAITVDVAELMTVLKNISVTSSSVGTKFKVDGSSLVKVFGEKITIFTSETTRLVYILDDNGNVVGTITVSVNSDSTKDYDL